MTPTAIIPSIKSDELNTLRVELARARDTFPVMEDACESCGAPTPVHRLEQDCCPACIHAGYAISVFSPARFGGVR